VYDYFPPLNQRENRANKSDVFFVMMMMALVEHASDLTFTLLNLQDNFDLEGFERYRQASLVALLTSAPMIVGPCIIEQLFYHQYSIIQRLEMLDSLVRVTLELGDFQQQQGLPQNGPITKEQEFKKIKSPAIHQLLLDYQSSSSEGPSNRALPEGSSSVLLPDPAPTREYIAQQPPPTRLSARLISQRKQYQSLDHRSHPTHSLSSSGSKPPGHLEKIFLNLLVTRLDWYLDSTFSEGGGRSSSITGPGSMILWDPFLLLKLVQTIQLFSLLTLSRLHPSSSSGSHIDPQSVIEIKEVVALLLRILGFLRPTTNSNHSHLLLHPKQQDDDDDDGDVNRPRIVGLIVGLIIHLISALSSSFSSLTPSSSNYPTPETLLPSSSTTSIISSPPPTTPDSQSVHLNLLFSQFWALVSENNHRRPSVPFDDDDAGGVVDQRFLDVKGDRLVLIVTQILELIV
jgi:hypothetical protein